MINIKSQADQFFYEAQGLSYAHNINAEKIKTIDYFSLSHPLRSIASKISFDARIKMFQIFMKTMRPTPMAKVIDVGITPDITLPESNFFEKLYPYPKSLVTTSIEDASLINKICPGVSFVQTSQYLFPFRDNSFDILFCSAVLEHVGSEFNQKNFIKELLRISKQFFIITPNRIFPIEFHTFLPFTHWLPQKCHQSILKMVGMNFWAETANLNLLTPSKIINLFPKNVDVKIKYHFIMGIPSNIITYGYSSYK